MNAILQQNGDAPQLAETGHSGVVASLEQIKPFALNPRLSRNPCYDELKASIRQRGLDNPPLLTRSPNDQLFTLASGGNTRLAILNELWQETGEERFHTLFFPFLPWPDESGELRCLIGHLAENDLHGKLTFIERAQGIDSARKLIQQQHGITLSQRELAERLTLQGYPISQSHISKMEQTLTWLLPCIPDLLYQGLGRSTIEKLLALRSSVMHLQEKHPPTSDLDQIFGQVLSTFNHGEDGLVIHHFQDELLGQLSGRLDVDFNLLLLEMDEATQKRQALLGKPEEPPPWKPPEHADTKPRSKEPTREKPTPTPSLHENEPVNDIWKIEPLFDSPESLRPMADRLAWDIATISGLENYVTPVPENGVGFSLLSPPVNGDRACYQLLSFLTGERGIAMPALEMLISPERDDQQILKILRLIRISRRIFQLEKKEERS
ncbi:ParB family protein of integrating conjugative element (PFGI_1 class) [Erwinia toletana]|uniref:ParB family protein of integrating conjugative element (PFGI_1 class) n=1 Tax=Winslowiella toletana TaxID=92490 RepID=A0ABS4PDM9_9GAMM|nr:ParB family protein [Winslowiella toletana]MBP2170750.1 ParB family protein of integrating conjugative element (PFGI_1 class) [Winslowiella toletana]